jgi:preprotein translocase subunit YajC
MDKKRLTTIVSAVVMVITAIAAFLIVRNIQKNNNPLAGESSRGNCKILECMEQLNGNMSVADINDVIGFEGELKSETELYKTYVWELSEKTSIEAMISQKYGTASIEAEFPYDLRPTGADFSKWDEIQSKLKKGDKITYDEFVSLVGGVQGVLNKVDSSSKTYHWYNSDGGYLFGIFNESGYCTLASGRF